MDVGIQALNVYGGSAYLDVRSLFEARGLDLGRFENLMMEKKSVALPWEDPISNAVNAAKPIIDGLSEVQRNRIEMVLVGSESGLDFGKAMSGYVHDHLGLARECRLFEVKQACYGGTAALQTAVNFVRSGASPGASVLVIATDVARGLSDEALNYAEPSQGTGAVAMLISDQPRVLRLDFGANGYHAYEVMDTFRPRADLEHGDPDLSLLSYLDCLEVSYRNYARKVKDVDLARTFDYLIFHTPFGGMVKGAHRKLMRTLLRAKPDEIAQDFQARVWPSLHYCVQVGNVYSATLYFALAGLIDQAPQGKEVRVGLFSYGSGCSSEFFSGVLPETAKGDLAKMQIQQRLDARVPLEMGRYDRILEGHRQQVFGVKDMTVPRGDLSDIYDGFFAGRGLLVLKGINNYHREYAWS